MKKLRETSPENVGKWTRINGKLYQALNVVMTVGPDDYITYAGWRESRKYCKYRDIKEGEVRP